jgi:hypothetical protein
MQAASYNFVHHADRQTDRGAGALNCGWEASSVIIARWDQDHTIGDKALSKFKEFCCWLTGHGWQTRFETRTVGGFVIQRLVEMRCQFCGKVEKVERSRERSGFR